MKCRASDSLEEGVDHESKRSYPHARGCPCASSWGLQCSRCAVYMGQRPQSSMGGTADRGRVALLSRWDSQAGFGQSAAEL